MKTKLVAAALMAMVMISSLTRAEEKTSAAKKEGHLKTFLIKVPDTDEIEIQAVSQEVVTNDFTLMCAQIMGYDKVSPEFSATMSKVFSIKEGRLEDLPKIARIVGPKKERMGNNEYSIRHFATLFPKAAISDGKTRIGNTPEELEALRRRGIRVEQHHNVGPITGGGKVDIGTVHIDRESSFGGGVHIQSDVRTGSIHTSP